MRAHVCEMPSHRISLTQFSPGRWRIILTQTSTPSNDPILRVQCAPGVCAHLVDMIFMCVPSVQNMSAHFAQHACTCVRTCQLEFFHQHNCEREGGEKYWRFLAPVLLGKYSFAKVCVCHMRTRARASSRQKFMFAKWPQTTRNVFWTCATCRRSMREVRARHVQIYWNTHVQLQHASKNWHVSVHELIAWTQTHTHTWRK